MQLSRLTGPLVLALLLATAWVALEGGLRAVSEVSPLWLPRGKAFVRNDWLRVRDADFNAPPCAVLGLSNVREGFSLEALNAAPLGCRWLGLGGAGPAAAVIARQARALLESEVRLGIVVVGVSPFHLLDASGARVEERTPGLSWLQERGVDVRRSIELSLLPLRDPLRVTEYERIAAAEPNPWGEMPHFEWQRKMSIGQQVEAYRKRGYFDAGAYEAATEQPAILSTLMDALRARGATAFVIDMPQHPSLRAALPVDGLPARALGHPPVPVIDMRSALSPEQLVDVSHPNRAGQKVLSNAVIQALLER